LKRKPNKLQQYRNMNMTHFSQRRPTKEACLSLVYRATCTVKEKQAKGRRKHGNLKACTSYVHTVYI
jgi:hypothetical protein